MKVLLLDVGNTAIKYLITEMYRFEPLKMGYIKFEDLNRLEEFKNIPAYVSTVKPSLNKILKEIFPKLHFFSLGDCKKVIKINYTGSTLGVDRVLSCLGGLDYNISNNFACLNFGTATTVNIVFKETFIGGAIFLGLQKELECLASKTEQLPILDFEDLNISPLGNSTGSNILGGVFYKHVFAIEGFVKLIKEKYGINTFFITGGLGKVFAERIKGSIFDPLLLFRGMFKLIKNHKDINQV